MQPRSIASVVPAPQFKEGGGFIVHRPFPTGQLDHVDPFLLLDEMGPVTYGVGEAVGAPDHPHRGFETVTYLLEGGMQHRDSAGHAGGLRPGDVQWMTAGEGVVHSEMPSDAMMREGGNMHGFQIWVNLPRADKMTHPRYQEIPGERIPVWRSADGRVTAKVISGQVESIRAVIETHTPIVFLHLILEPGASFTQPIEAGFNAFAFVFEGALALDGERRSAPAHAAVIYRPDGDAVTIRAADGDRPVQALLLAGKPIGEPVARYGPFVMNTRDELVQAFEDFHAGRMGHIPAEVTH
ncbi:MAG TPA: pirin family protein [Candidatus Dormibacteraeota bacterium]|nr:pirin family protein [Candidatus Dormibacteraeota bacterium]